MNTTNTKKAHKPAPAAPRNLRENRPAKRSFFRSLVSHMMVAIIAVLGVSAYIHWNDLLNYTGSRVCSYNVLGKYAPQTPKVPPIATPRSDAKATAQTPKKTPLPVNDKAAGRQSKAPGTSRAADLGTAQKKTEKSAENPAPDSQPGPTVKIVPKQPKNLEKDLEAARKLFWVNDKRAVTAYEALVRRYPGNPELMGELGNVYFKIGDKQKAADMYFAAGRVFAVAGNDGQKAQMIKILEKLDPKKARKLSNVAKKPEN